MNNHYDDVLWFEVWCKNNNVDNRIYNAVSKSMNERRITLSTLLDMDENDFIGWKGFGKKSREIFVKNIMPKLTDDYYNRENYIHEHRINQAL